MKFKLDISVSDEDYIAYYQFHLLRSDYGKKLSRNNRIIILSCMALISAFILCIAISTGQKHFLYYLSSAAFLGGGIIYFIFFDKLFARDIENNLKNRLKHGHNLYTKNYTIEFYDDKTVSYSAEEKTESSYSKIEKVCCVDEKYIYLYVNAESSHIIPLSAFESPDQYREFLDFIESRGKNIDIYLAQSNDPIEIENNSDAVTTHEPIASDDSTDALLEDEVNGEATATESAIYTEAADAPIDTDENETNGTVTEAAEAENEVKEEATPASTGEFSFFDSQVKADNENE